MHVEAVITCPDHHTPCIVYGIRVVEGASPRYLFACQEANCKRMLRIVAKTVCEVTLVSKEGEDT